MICAYCGHESKVTKEHIISSSVLDLFPECFLTIDRVRGTQHLTDPVIKDVCIECNNKKISYIDSYSRQLISKYFISNYKKNDRLDFTYSYSLVQKVLLKYAYNDSRSYKKDTSFFTRDILDFLMDETTTDSLTNVTVMAGLAINLTPWATFMFGNEKITWGRDPYFFSRSIVEVNYKTSQIYYRNNNLQQKFKSLNFSYLFRFNSVQFLLMCWNPDITNEDLEENDMLLHQYPYTILSGRGHDFLSRCTSEGTYFIPMLIDVRYGQEVYDNITTLREYSSSTSQKQFFKDKEEEWIKEEKILSKKYPR